LRVSKKNDSRWAEFTEYITEYITRNDF
jgi:hypothetical protein